MNKFKNELDCLHHMLECKEEDIESCNNSIHEDSDLNILLTDDQRRNCVTPDLLGRGKYLLKGVLSSRNGPAEASSLAKISTISTSND